jgi:decaprenylphosphoryl-5-phosphoribose phosphatase
MTEPARSRLSRLDVHLLLATRRRLGAGPVVGTARALSAFGEHALGWLAVGAVGAVGELGARRSEWLRGAAGVLAAHASAVVVKRVVRRQRPRLAELPALVTTPSELSFPSAHSSSTAAAAVGYAPMLGRPLMGALLAGMGVSRVLLGVHYPSDVAAGVVLGSVSARAARAAVDRAARGRAS